jgi:CDP-glucose 4,6-dehydratase
MVTGHSGFVGSWLTVALLRLGADVVGFSADADPDTRARSAELSRLGAVSEVGDVRNFDAVHRVMSGRQFDTVFHLAAQPLVSVGLADPLGTLSVNINGSLHILEAARRCAPGVLVHVTSDKCYRNRGWPWPYRENDELGGGCPYSVSKAAAEIIFEGLAAMFAPGGGTTAASVRFGNIIGGGDYGARRLVPDLLGALSEGRSIELRSPSAVRPFQHVIDVVHGLLLLADALREGSVPHGTPLNFAPPWACNTVLELTEALVEAWVEDGGTAPPVRIVQGDFPEEDLLSVDGHLAASLLGWRHLLPLKHAAAATVAWHRAVRLGTASAQATSDQLAALLPGMAEQGRQLSRRTEWS